MTKKTTDIYLAAALLALGGKLENVDREEPRHMVFEFSAPPSVLPEIQEQNLNTWETSWANGELMISATAYADAIRKMKSIVHSR